jgi:hypothetical protein
MMESFFSLRVVRVSRFKKNCELRTQWAAPGPEERRCQRECQKECQIECQNIYAIQNSRWYVRNYVRIVVQGEDQLQESILVSGNTRFQKPPGNPHSNLGQKTA